MKEDKIIIGAELVQGKMMKVTLDTVVTVKPKIKLMDMVSKDLSEMQQAVQGVQSYKSVHYIPLETWREIGYKIGSKVSIEMLPVEYPSPKEE